MLTAKMARDITNAPTFITVEELTAINTILSSTLRGRREAILYDYGNSLKSCADFLRFWGFTVDCDYATGNARVKW